MKTRFASLLLVVASAGCGGDPLDPGSGDDPGGGTNTLLVEGRVSGEPRVTNSQTETDFDVDVELRVELNGVDVTTGTVTVMSRFATITLAYNANDQRWTGRGTGYDQTYQLDVISGEDEVRGVIVDGPDLHHFTAPMAGASLDSTIANEVKWARDVTADIITFRADNIDRISITDTGSYSMAPGALKAERDQATENTLEIRRTNHTVPRGAVAGSDFAVSIENDLDVVALPNPAL